MSDVLSTISTRAPRATPQSQKTREDQVLNAAGGYVFQAGDDIRLHRFLTIGTDGGTYYTNAKSLTKDNAEVVFREVARDGVGTVAKIVEISQAGRAPKNKQALFALAIAASHGDDRTHAAALAALPEVARIGTHLFEFLGYVEQFRGWGRGLRKGIGRWYEDKPVEKLAYQMVKYRQREGWTHGDALRLAHLNGDGNAVREVLYRWAGRRYKDDTTGLAAEAHHLLPALVVDFEALQRATTVREVVALINAGHGISWEMIPDQFINERKVWEALLDQGVPQTALMRQLPRLTRLGITSGDYGRGIADQLQDPDRLKKARVHPINVLVAQRTYAQGVSERGSSTWTPARLFVDALDTAFYNAFPAVEAAGKRTLLAMDVSGSMTSKASGVPLSCREVSGALALVTAATEPEYEVIGFTSGGWSYKGGASSTRYGGWGHGGVSRLDISPRRRLDDNIKAISDLSFGGTDASLPMLWAAETKQSFDTFSVYTDNETWAGTMHVHQALDHYKQRMGINARLQVVSMTATGSSLCDPLDPNQMDVSGFDSTVPQLLADHSAGRI